MALSSRSSKAPTTNTFAHFLRFRDEQGTWPSFIILFYFCRSLRRGGFCCSFSLEIVKEYDVNL